MEEDKKKTNTRKSTNSTKKKTTTKATKEVKENVEKTVSEKTDYSKLTVAELKSICEEKGIATTGMKKADLVAALEK